MCFYSAFVDIKVISYIRKVQGGWKAIAGRWKSVGKPGGWKAIAALVQSCACRKRCSCVGYLHYKPVVQTGEVEPAGSSRLPVQ